MPRGSLLPKQKRFRAPVFRGMAMAAAVGAITAYGAEAITGRVVNGSSAALANAKVWLKSRPDLVDSTGPDGRFSLDLTPSALGHSPGRGTSMPAFRLQHNRLVLTLPWPREVSLELRNAQGRKAATLFKGR